MLARGLCPKMGLIRMVYSGDINSEKSLCDRDVYALIQDRLS
jgi:hypothetical protein